MSPSPARRTLRSPRWACALVLWILAGLPLMAQAADDAAFVLGRPSAGERAMEVSPEGVHLLDNGRVLFERQYQDIRNSTLDLLRRFSPNEYFFVGVGRSPVSNIAFLQALNPGIAMHFPASGLHALEKVPEAHVAEYARHFAAFLPDEKALGGRKILLVDHGASGSSIARVREMLDRYLTSIGSIRKVEGAAFVRHTSSIEHLDMHLVPVDKYPFMLLPPELAPYAEHPIGPKRLEELQKNSAYDRLLPVLRAWMSRDTTLDVFLSDRRDRPPLKDGVPRLAPTLQRTSDPTVKEMTNRCLTAIGKLLERGAISEEALGSFAEKHSHEARDGHRSLIVSELVPERDASTADRWAARQLLQQYDAHKVEPEVILRWVTEVHQSHVSARAQVKRNVGGSLVMDFLGVKPGKMVWEGRSIDLPEHFDVLTTPLLRQHWEGLGRPVRKEPAKIFDHLPGFDAPIVFSYTEVPKLLEAMHAKDSSHEYRLLTENEWLFLATDRGTRGPSDWGSDGKLLLDHAWLQENHTEAPYIPAPPRGRKPTLVAGQPIWGLFGNAQQLVKSDSAVLQRSRGHHTGGNAHGAGGKLVGSSLLTPSASLTDPAHWVRPYSGGLGAIRLTRRDRK